MTARTNTEREKRLRRKPESTSRLAVNPRSCAIMSEIPSGRLTDRVALVTGAGSGIGASVAELFAREGARVLVTDRDAAAAERAAAGIRDEGGAALACALDVTIEDDWIAAIGRARDEWGALHIVVNNAGIAHGAPLTETTLAEWNRVLAVNLGGVFLGLKHGIPALREAGGGSVVNVSSASGSKPAPGAAAYSASKAAVRMLSKVAALECAGAGETIRVNTVLPGGVRTPMWEHTQFFRDLVAQGGEAAAWQALEGTTPAGRFAAPLEIAQAVLFLASDVSSYINAAEICVDYGYSA